MRQNKNFILIFGLIPTESNQTDGMIQRELAIDSLIEDTKRIYIEKVDDKFTFFRHPKKYLQHYFKKKNYILKNNVVNLQVIKSGKLYQLCKEAKVIYVHSLWSAYNNLSIDIIKVFKHKIIVDIHGCVPEECDFAGMNYDFVKQLEQFEAMIFNMVETFIAVSKNMILYYKQKYPKIKNNFILLPIFSQIDDINLKSIKKISKKSLTIIYSGGTQKWQKVNLIVKFINIIANKYYNIVILTPDTKTFINKIDNLYQKNIIIKNVLPDNLYKEYIKADIGIVFRDDIVVNQVACPTKMIDYLSNGIVPCVLQPNIGDFKKLGYKYITISDFLKNKIPNVAELENMKKENYKILKTLQIQQKNGKIKLKNTIHKIMNCYHKP